MENDPREIDLLRDIIRSKDKQLEAYKRQVGFLHSKIRYLQDSIKTFNEAGQLLSQIGENPLDYEMTYFREDNFDEQ